MPHIISLSDFEAAVKRFFTPDEITEMEAKIIAHREDLDEEKKQYGTVEDDSDLDWYAAYRDIVDQAESYAAEDNNRLTSEVVWKRAVDFLTLYIKRSWERYGVKLVIPTIFPGPDGSIDLHWDRSESEMLVNIPADAGQPVTFYGDDKKGSSVRGSISAVELYNESLMLWLNCRHVDT